MADVIAGLEVSSNPSSLKSGQMQLGSQEARTQGANDRDIQKQRTGEKGGVDMKRFEVPDSDAQSLRQAEVSRRLEGIDTMVGEISVDEAIEMPPMSTVPIATDVLIEDAEKARRRFAVDNARGNQRGLHFSLFMYGLEARYIDGELSNEDVIAELDRHYGLTRK